jgi:hypothetical protein
MQFQDTSVPTDEAELLALWLKEGNYESLEDWMYDSDYTYSHDDGEWYDEDGNCVLPEGQAITAMEAEDGPLWRAYVMQVDG